MLNQIMLKQRMHIVPSIGFTLCIICCFCISCADKKAQVGIGQFLIFDAGQIDTLLSETIERIDFLVLEETDNSALYGVSKMVIKNNLIFIGDFHSGKIVVYDMSGKVKYVLDKKGAGPQEYLELKSFAVDEHYIYTLDNFRHAVNSYDCQTGRFIQSRKLSFVAWDMEVLDNDHFIFAFIPLKDGQINLKQPPYKILITDKYLEITDKYLKYEKGDYEFIGKTTFFTQAEKGIVFSSMASDTFILFSSKDSLEYTAINFKDKIPDKFRKERKKILDYEYNFLLKTPLLCKDCIEFEISVGDNIGSYIYDKNTGCFHGNAEISSYNYLFEPIASYRNQLISYLDNYSLYEEVVETGFTKASSSIEHHLQNEGAILIFYTIR